MRKSFNFGQKAWTNFVGKGQHFGAPYNVIFLV